MSKVLAVILATILVAIAGLHLYWGIGGFWPGHDEASLVDMVIGAPAGTSIPPLWACLVVVVCLLVPASTALMISAGKIHSFPSIMRWIPVTALWVSAFVFIARGLSTYFSPLLLNIKGTAFYELDRLIYAPICLVLGVGLIMVWFFRPRVR